MDREFVDYVVEDLLGELPNIYRKKMFGSYGLYRGENFFAIITDGELYLKITASEKQKEFEALGSSPFVYTREGKKVALKNYWLVPAEVLEDKEKLISFIVQ